MGISNIPKSEGFRPVAHHDAQLLILTFLTRHRFIKLICFNGAKAGKIFHHQVLPRLAPEFPGIRREATPLGVRVSNWEFAES